MGTFKQLIKPLIWCLIGGYFVYLAQSHSPFSNEGEILARELTGSFTITKSGYFLLLAIGLIPIAFGVGRIYSEMKAGKQ